MNDAEKAVQAIVNAAESAKNTRAHFSESKSSKMRDQIKTALADGACESVAVKLSDDGVYSVFNEQSELIWLTHNSKPIESFTVNRRTFEPFDVGDLVDTPAGRKILFEIEDYDYVFKNEAKGENNYLIYKRHELVLLKKAK